jgi:hypothetical protein
MQANDIVVSNWAEFDEALYDIPRTAFQTYRSDFVYRGVADWFDLRLPSITGCPLESWLFVCQNALKRH